MRTPWVALRDIIRSKPRFLQAGRDGLFANFTIVSLALLRRSADTDSELATAWPCSCQTNPTISSWSMLVPGLE
jgi:hypothetical protein